MSGETDARTIKSARVTHVCSWCEQAIEIGSTYKRHRYYSNDGPGTTKMHPECDVALVRWSRDTGETEWTSGEFERGCDCPAGDCQNQGACLKVAP
jgi:hypothetical protein